MKRKWVTLSVDEEIYKIVKDKQNELLQRKDGDKVELSYVTEEAILNGIDSVITPFQKKIKENSEFGD